MPGSTRLRTPLREAVHAIAGPANALGDDRIEMVAAKQVEPLYGEAAMSSKLGDWGSSGGTMESCSSARSTATTSRWFRFSFLVLLCAGGFVRWPFTVRAEDDDRVRRIHDASNRLIGTIERLSDGSERVYDRNNRYQGSAEKSVTYDATGRAVSPERAPELLLPHADAREGHGN
jgi:hypothetical protein